MAREGDAIAFSDGRDTTSLSRENAVHASKSTLNAAGTNRLPQPGESELFFGIVGPMGIGGEPITADLQKALAGVGFTSNVIHVIELLHAFRRWRNMPEAPAEQRYWRHIQAGNEFCGLLERGDALAVLALGSIRKIRKQKSGDTLISAPGNAYILRSLKRPSEVETLRAVYGPAFFLVAAYSPRNKRVDNLADILAGSHGAMQADYYRASAEKLIAADEKESDQLYGQDVRETFSRADVFVDASDTERLERELDRFIRILFGDSSHTPSRDEYAMAHARVAALRSADPSRQVGAAVATPEGTVITVGTNEVPKAGGGQYWEGDYPDGRDRKRGKNASYTMRRRVLGDTLSRLARMGWLVDEKSKKSAEDLMALTDEALEGLMKEARVMSAIEFGRIVHAEMAALLDAARLGFSVKGCTLYSTTFPCHGCAHHIVAAGIARVVYIHPYTKSLAQQLFEDSIVVDNAPSEDSKVPFVPFVGVSPDRYFEFFNLIDRASPGELIREWSFGDPPRFTGYPESYTAAEAKEIGNLGTQINATEELDAVDLEHAEVTEA